MRYLMILLILFLTSCDGGSSGSFEIIGEDYGTVVVVGDSRAGLGSWYKYSWLNFGGGGYTTDDVMDGISDVMAENPDISMIQVGHNDFYYGASVAEVFNGIVTIVNILGASDVYVTSVLPGKPDFAKIAELNDLLRDYCNNTGFCTYVDLSAQLFPDGYLLHTYDGVHLTGEGYDIWYDEIILYF